MVADCREPCPECQEIFGPMLQPSRGEPVSAEHFADVVAERDRDTAQAYRAMREIAAVAEAVEWKLNQLCWVCEERRKCRPDDHQGGAMICKPCWEGYDEP